MNPVGDIWEMYASAGPEGSDDTLRFFGPLGFAKMDTTASRVVKVMLEPTDEPEDGDYWAWLDPGAWQPSCIAATEREMTDRFLLDQTDAPGPREEQEVGLGQILRLRVSILSEEVLRSGRNGWRPNISSAM